jgi:hypothetical protein
MPSIRKKERKRGGDRKSERERKRKEGEERKRKEEKRKERGREKRERKGRKEGGRKGKKGTVLVSHCCCEKIPKKQNKTKKTNNLKKERLILAQSFRPLLADTIAFRPTVWQKPHGGKA